MTNIYSDATARGVCWFCNGKKGFDREVDINSGGHHVEAHFEPCGSCKGTGLPSDEQLHKAKLEQEALCTYCEFELSLHGGQTHPHGCDKAIRTIVQEQRIEIRNLKAQLAEKT